MISGSYKLDLFAILKSSLVFGDQAFILFQGFKVQVLKTSRCNNFKTSWDQAITSLVFKAWCHIFLGFRIPGFQYSRFRGVKILRFPEFSISRFHEIRVSRAWSFRYIVYPWTFEFQALNMPRLQGFKILRFPDSEISRLHEMRASRAWSFWNIELFLDLGISGFQY